jgi:hypothetical protein
VIDTELLDVDAFRLSQDPAVIALGKKYTDPEARKELFRNGQLGLPSKIKQGKRIQWSDVEVGEYQKLSKADYWIRIVEGRAREPLASPDKDGKVPRHEMLDVVDQGKKGFRDAPRIDLSRLDAEFLKQAYQAAKDGREIHKNGDALQQDSGLGQRNV